MNIFINTNFDFRNMEGLITNFRGGRHTKYDNQMIIKVAGVDSKDNAKEMIGKNVSWESSSGKKINGKISNSHGNLGLVRVIFEKGMPGQAIAKKVRIE